MTELSPATRAVLIAEAKSRCLREERDCHPNEDDWNGCWFCVHRRGLAAALRAAALNCKRDTLILLAMADELEAQ